MRSLSLGNAFRVKLSHHELAFMASAIAPWRPPLAREALECFSVARMRQVCRCRIAGAGRNDFGVTRGNLTKTGFEQARMAKLAYFS